MIRFGGAPASSPLRLRFARPSHTASFANPAPGGGADAVEARGLNTLES
jgi:hypothetical protein